MNKRLTSVIIRAELFNVPMIYKPLYLSIADFIIKVDFGEAEYFFLMKKLNKDIKIVLGGFILNKYQGNPDFFINVVEKQEQSTIKRKNITCIEIYTDNLPNSILNIPSTISIFHFSIILREITSYLLNKTHSGVFFHCSAIKHSGKAIIFTGRSGAGKSTIVSLLRSRYPILSDDIGILREKKGTYYYYQSPTFEKNSKIMKTYNKYSLKSIYFLKKSQFFKQVKIKEKSDILDFISEQSIINTGMGFHKYSHVSFRWLSKFLQNFNYFSYLYFKKNKNGLLSEVAL